MLDEPDNYLDVPGKLWLEEQIKASPKTILLISHDRALLNAVADRIITVEDGQVWVHGGSFATYHDARKARYERQEEILKRWTEEHERLKELVRTLQGQAKSSPDMASKYRAMQTRLRKFEEAGAPEAPPQDQNIKMNLRGSRTGVRVITCEQTEIAGLLKPFDLEIFFGDRLAVLGPNGAGKSHLLRLFAETEADEIKVGKAWSGKKKIGARVVPGHFAQTHAHPEWVNHTPIEIVNKVKPMLLNESIGILRKYELSKQAEQKFQTLSGGQQARLQILVLELAGCNLLLLDEPTDNLDLASAEALQDSLDAFQGTVIAVTHDRWFADSFDRYLYVGADGVVRETTAPLWA
jgi:ATPase subunit of ABC transporter with duplicated ATPase domains